MKAITKETVFSLKPDWPESVMELNKLFEDGWTTKFCVPQMEKSERSELGSRIVYTLSKSI
jgi:hypothetical protein